MNVHFSGFERNGLAFIDEAQAQQLKNVLVQPGDVLLNITGASIGRVTIAPPDMDGARVNQHVCIVRPRDEVSPSFLRWFFASPGQQRRIEKIQKGVTRPGLTKQQILDWEIPVPDRTVQDRVVSKLDGLFSGLDAGVAALQRARANLKRYRATVLKAAVEGKLIERNADESLFDREKWGLVDDAIDDLSQGWSPKCHRHPAPTAIDWGVMKTSAVVPMEFREGENKQLPPALEARPHLELTAGDVLITRAGPRGRCGIACLIRKTRPRLMLCDKVYRLRCRTDVVQPEFLEIVLNAPQILDSIERLKTGISDSGVNLTQKKLRSLRIPILGLEAQAAIVAEIERQFSVVAATERTMNAALARQTRLRQGVLRSAFNGSLSQGNGR